MYSIQIRDVIVPPIGGIPPLEPKASISKIFKDFFGENVVFFFLA